MDFDTTTPPTGGTVLLAAARAKRIYVAGPMTGLPELNFPAFHAAAAMLHANGWHVENPADHGIVEGANWADYMHSDLAQLASCSAIYLLPGWSKSRGARLEAHVAQTLGMQFIVGTGAEDIQAVRGEYWGRLCALQKYSFLLNRAGGVARVQDPSGNWVDVAEVQAIVDDAGNRLAELGGYKVAFDEWIDKTKWLRATIKPAELGKHLADVLRERVEALEARVQADADDAERYRALRDESLQADEDDPCVMDSTFSTYFGDELDDAADILRRRAAARAQEGGAR